MLGYVRLKLILLSEERVYLWGHNTNDSRVVSNVNEKNWSGVKKKPKKTNGQATRVHLRVEWQLKQLLLAPGSENKERGRWRRSLRSLTLPGREDTLGSANCSHVGARVQGCQILQLFKRHALCGIFSF